MSNYCELIKVTATDLPNSNSTELPKKLPIRTSWELITKKLPMTQDFTFTTYSEAQGVWLE